MLDVAMMKRIRCLLEENIERVSQSKDDTGVCVSRGFEISMYCLGLPVQ